MSRFTKPLPLSLYVHIPWCVRKCPYCDFNSHEAKKPIPEELYVTTLLQELNESHPFIHDRSLISIFFGGGTPSLFSAKAIEQILTGINRAIPLGSHTEITLEANPGTIDQVRFNDFRLSGINRLSLGIQSLQDEKLKILGRIHDRNHALRAITTAQKAGFSNINLDLMYGLPHQSIDDALEDIETALAFYPTHLSWYQLTIEPNTLFHHQPPPLPPDDFIWEMQLAGQACIQQAGLQQYEVSAYSLRDKTCLHNQNYWEFGDYLGIGAGAHSKITHDAKVTRFSQVKHPHDYLDPAKRQLQNRNVLSEQELIFEFMLNALRLTQGIPIALFSDCTGLAVERIEPLLIQAKQRGLLMDNPAVICPTDLGKRFLNDLMGMFLP